jgi:hypothetical protein
MSNTVNRTTVEESGITTLPVRNVSNAGHGQYCFGALQNPDRACSHYHSSDGFRGTRLAASNLELGDRHPGYIQMATIFGRSSG